MQSICSSYAPFVFTKIFWVVLWWLWGVFGFLLIRSLVMQTRYCIVTWVLMGRGIPWQCSNKHSVSPLPIPSNFLQAGRSVPWRGGCMQSVECILFRLQCTTIVFACVLAHCMLLVRLCYNLFLCGMCSIYAVQKPAPKTSTKPAPKPTP